MIVHHPALQRQIEIQPQQWRVLAKSGWQLGPLPPPKPRRAAAVQAEAEEESSTATDKKE